MTDFDFPIDPPFRIVSGAIHVGTSRICLDLVVEQLEHGMTPEEVVDAYDTLKLVDVHRVVDFYRQYHDEIQAYMKRREEEADRLRAFFESRRLPVTHAELLARRAAQESADASAGQ